ncbi:retrovirus-related pol polyprotein from transposon TNT 1-94 [Tanacetum coccineum]
MSNFMASQDARLSKFEADFKQQQGEITNKIDTVLKVITDRMAGALPSDTKSQIQKGMRIRTQPTEDPEKILEDEFKDLHLNLPILEVPALALMYNAILDKYVDSLELGKNRFTFIQGEMPKNLEDPRLFTLPCRLGDSKPFDTLADLGACTNIIPLYLFKKLNIGLLEETDHVFGLADGTKSYHIGIVRDVEVYIGRLKLLTEFYVIDMKKDLETPLLVGRGFLATVNAVIDYRKAKIAVGEGITRLIFDEKKLGNLRRKFHWSILGGRFNPVITSSSTLLSK